MSLITTRAVCCFPQAVAIRYRRRGVCTLRQAQGARSLRQSELCRPEPKTTRGWELSTAPKTSTYTMWADETADPTTLFCQVGSTQLKYQLRCIDGLYAWLVEQGDWVDLGAADKQKPAKEGTVEPGAALRTTRSAAGTASARVIAVGSDVSAAAPRGARQSRAHPRRTQQQGPRHRLSRSRTCQRPSGYSRQALTTRVR
jgi:hypothetical protein